MSKGDTKATDNTRRIILPNQRTDNSSRNLAVVHRSGSDTVTGKQLVTPQNDPEAFKGLTDASLRRTPDAEKAKSMGLGQAENLSQMFKQGGLTVRETGPGGTGRIELPPGFQASTVETGRDMVTNRNGLHVPESAITSKDIGSQAKQEFGQAFNTLKRAGAALGSEIKEYAASKMSDALAAGRRMIDNVVDSVKNSTVGRAVSSAIETSKEFWNNNNSAIKDVARKAAVVGGAIAAGYGAYKVGDMTGVNQAVTDGGRALLGNIADNPVEYGVGAAAAGVGAAGLKMWNSRRKMQDTIRTQGQQLDNLTLAFSQLSDQFQQLRGDHNPVAKATSTSD